MPCHLPQTRLSVRPNQHGMVCGRPRQCTDPKADRPSTQTHTAWCAGSPRSAIRYELDSPSRHGVRVPRAPSAMNRTVCSPEPARHSERAVPSAPNRIARPPEPARHLARAVPSTPNGTVRLLRTQLSVRTYLHGTLGGQSRLCHQPGPESPSPEPSRHCARVMPSTPSRTVC